MPKLWPEWIAGPWTILSANNCRSLFPLKYFLKLLFHPFIATIMTISPCHNVTVWIILFSPLYHLSFGRLKFGLVSMEWHLYLKSDGRHTGHLLVSDTRPFFPVVSIHCFRLTEVGSLLTCKICSLSLSRLHVLFPRDIIGVLIWKKQPFFLLYCVGFRSDAHFFPLSFAKIWLSLVSSVFISSVRLEKRLRVQIYLG